METEMETETDGETDMKVEIFIWILPEHALQMICTLSHDNLLLSMYVTQQFSG